MFKQILYLVSLLFGLAAQADIELINGNKMLESVRQQIVNIDTSDLNKILDKNPKAVLIDVRSPFEIKQTGTINRAQNVNIVRGWLEFQISDFAHSKDTPIIVYCGRNLRSPLAAKTLENMGYRNVKNYADGFFTWKEKSLPVKISDAEPDNILYRLPIKVADGVYSAIGATQPYTFENSNHNNNLSFIVTTDGVLVFNAGGSYLVAKALHQEIKKITHQPVKYVVLENSQIHAILGSNYWQEQGAIIVAHSETDKEISKNAEALYSSALKVQKDKLIGTKIVRPDLIFEDKLDLSMGETHIEMMHIGASHSPDDIQLWLPEQRLLISGDTTFNERMLPIFAHTDTLAWIKTWDKIEALNPKIIIPGHGKPTDLATITKFTKDYLVYMRAEVEKILDADGDLNDAYNIDQSMFRDRGTYRELHRRNAELIFRQMEFE
jgi:rhodanese-related sulfurtransferase/glyoxylase-like metal-dependent hydrolase (beta-lactamase superfamily II)